MNDDRPGRGADQFPLRFPEGMRDRLKAEAAKNGRSLNSEILQRLEFSFHFDDHEAHRRLIPPAGSQDDYGTPGPPLGSGSQPLNPDFNIEKSIIDILRDLRDIKLKVVGVRIREDGEQDFITERADGEKDSNSEPLPDPTETDALYGMAARLGYRVVKESEDRG